MRLLPWDPDIQTVISRIEAGVLDLQPDFQRGEVWSRVKKQRLVDSILRDWHVPPIHVIENTNTKRQEVLDGQQRLAAIRDFVRGEFAVDGSIEPLDAAIESMHGRKYRELPDEMKLLFDNFTLRIYRIVDFKSSEPAELFFRLNQPTNLTGAEQRNAFFGPVREQIKRLVEAMPSYGLGKELLGFSNSRMAYDDIICRVALTMERGSISTKIGANDLIELYRSEQPIKLEIEERLGKALQLFGEAGKLTISRPRFNKATVYSWLIFLVRGLVSVPQEFMQPKIIADFMGYFESERIFCSIGSSKGTTQSIAHQMNAEWLFSTYDDRSTSRVADVSSIILRDLVIWLVFVQLISIKSPETVCQFEIYPLANELSRNSSLENDAVTKIAIDFGWGALK